jgi:hypothetical protein
VWQVVRPATRTAVGVFPATPVWTAPIIRRRTVSIHTEGLIPMFRTALLVALVCVGVVAATASDALAQRPNRSISRPSLSPYSNMFRAEAGMVDPYLNLVRPYMQQTPPQQRMATRQTPPATMTNPGLTAESMRVRQRTAQQQQVGGIAPTGTNSVFMNMGHFYQTRNFRR